MNYEAFLTGLVDELEKVSSEEEEKEEKKESPIERLKERLEKKKEKKDDKKEEDKEEEKEASDMSALEVAFFNGLLEELEKSAGWRDLGAGRIAKMKQRMATGLKNVRGKALTNLKATGETGTKLYSVGKAKGGHGKFYERYGGKGFAERKRKAFAERRQGAGFQKRVQEAVQSRKPAPGPSLGQRMKSWGSGIKEKVMGRAKGVGGAVSGAAREVGRQAVGVGGAVSGAAKGAVSGAAEGRAAAMAPSVKTTAKKIPGRAKLTPVTDPTQTQVPEAA